MLLCDASRKENTSCQRASQELHLSSRIPEPTDSFSLAYGIVPATYLLSTPPSILRPTVLLCHRRLACSLELVL